MIPKTLDTSFIDQIVEAVTKLTGIQKAIQPIDTWLQELNSGTTTDPSVFAEKIKGFAESFMPALQAFGAIQFSFVCLVIGICICSGKQYDVKATEIIGLCLLIIGTVPLLALGFAGQTILDHAPGGVFGQWLYALMQPQIPSVAIKTCTFTAILVVYLKAWLQTELNSKTLGYVYVGKDRNVDIVELYCYVVILASLH